MKINLDFIYPIGSLYLTTNTINPSVLFGGTWERISNDAYLKIATGTNAGNLGGTSSQHKIPLTSIPSHTHGLFTDTEPGTAVSGWGVSTNIRGGQTLWANSQRMSYSGGGQAYYPYYYDVFVWKRTA
jgi:hypothetical protein